MGSSPHCRHGMAGSSVVGRNALAQRGVSAALLRRRHETEVAIFLALFEFRLSRSARYFCPLVPAFCRGRGDHRLTVIGFALPHPRVSHGLHGYVAHSHAGHRHYVWRNGHRYVYGYGYNPGAAVAAGVIAGTAAGYPYCGDYTFQMGRIMAPATTIVTATPIRITTMATGLVVRSSSQAAASTTVLTMASTVASLSTATGLISPVETSATWAA